MSTLKVTFLDKLKNETTLSYLIYDTHLSKKWIDLTKKNLSNPDSRIHSVISACTDKDLPELYNKLRSIANKINKLHNLQLPILNTYSIKDLNYMHEEFENYGELLDNNNADSIELTNLFFSLNENIHLCEVALSYLEKRSLQSSVLYDIHPVGLHQEIREEDKLYLVPSKQWGGLYLGYNTLGKHWFNISKDNDIDVIKRKMVKPQRRFAAETLLNFGSDISHVESVKAFYKWVNNLPIQIRQHVPIDDLNELTLGKFILGEVIIDEVFLKYEANKHYWKLPNHLCKVKWNNEVLRTFESIKEISIEE
jgi:hypothetical protein